MKRMWSKEELTEEIAGGSVETLDASKFSLTDQAAKLTASNAYKIGNMGIATIESITSVDTGGALEYDGKMLNGAKISDIAGGVGNITFNSNTSNPTVVIFEIF